jgi:hypothetical protein
MSKSKTIPPPKPIPLWTIPLSYDFRALLAWALREFEPQGPDAEMVCVMKTAIRDKSTEIIVDASQIDYLDRMGCAASFADHAARIDAPKFLKALDAACGRKADSVREVKAVAVVNQGSLFG